MPHAPATYRLVSRARKEQQWASRRTDYRNWYAFDIWKGPGGIRESVILRDLCQCQQCRREGRITLVLLHCEQGDSRTAHVDHVRPHEGDWERFVDEKNCETLCGACHSRKTRGEMG